MVDASTILERVQSFGANLVLDEGGGLRIVGREKLPASAIDYIADHRNILIQHLGGEASATDLESGEIDFGTGTPPEWLGLFADTLTRKRPANVLDADWQWFVTRCRQIMGEASWLKGDRA